MEVINTARSNSCAVSSLFDFRSARTNPRSLFNYRCIISQRACGGTGIRVRLRSVCRKTWEFKSPHAHPPSPSFGGARGRLAQLAERRIYTAKVAGPSPASPTNMETNIPILYEDENIVAVNKPAGVLTTELHYGVGYVHRLDKDTSGVLVFAKNKEAYDFLRKAFHDREVKKTYLAFVYGIPKEKRGVIDFDIGRSRKDFRLRSAQPKAKGKLRNAVTRYEVVGEINDSALLKINPETGRTHQIRVHLKAIHHPIVGDKLYAPKHPLALGISRLGLHASEINLPLPSGERISISAPIPEDLAPAFEYFTNPTRRAILSPDLND